MVRLRDVAPESFVITDKFQFQYGSIKSSSFSDMDGILPLFQFQYGSIKSFWVRNTRNGYRCFNSNMVRLRVTTFGALSTPLMLFQFQYGSIKRA